MSHFGTLLLSFILLISSTASATLELPTDLNTNEKIHTRVSGLITAYKLRGKSDQEAASLAIETVNKSLPEDHQLVKVEKDQAAIEGLGIGACIEMGMAMVGFLCVMRATGSLGKIVKQNNILIKQNGAILNQMGVETNIQELPMGKTID